MLAPAALRLVAFMGLAALSGGVAEAQPAPPPMRSDPEDAVSDRRPSSDFRPHRGLYLNVLAGEGELRFSGAGEEIAGRSYDIGLGVGIAAARQIVVYGDLYEAHVSDPFANTSLVSELDLHGFGAGVKYYFDPSNVFVSGGLLAFQITQTGPIGGPSNDETTHWGAMARLAVGREWWATPNWSFGLAGELKLGRTHNVTYDSPLTYEYSVKTASLLMSGTFGAPASEPSAYGWAGAAGDGTHTHDGFYLGVHVGVGWLKITGPFPTTGTGTPIGVAAGYAPKDNLILFAAYDRSTAAGLSGEIQHLQLETLGPGVRYYLEPSNVFLTAAVLAARISIDNGDAGDERYGYAETTRWGLAARASAGKEWWISRDWGLGLGAELLAGRTRTSNDVQLYWTKAASLLATASFN